MRMEHIFVLIHIRNKGEVVNVNMFKPFNIFTDYLNVCSLLSFFLFVFHVCHGVLSNLCNLVVTC